MYPILFIPNPIQTYTFPTWMLMATINIFPVKNSCHYLCLFPIALTKTPYSDLRNICVFIFMITTAIQVISSKSGEYKSLLISLLSSRFLPTAIYSTLTHVLNLFVHCIL